MKTKNKSLSKTRINWIREQGHFNKSDAEIVELATGNSFAYKLCVGLLIPGVVFANIPLLSAMGVIAFLSVVLPNHVFDYLFNLVFRKSMNLPKVPKRSPQLTFACSLATLFILSTITSFYMGYSILGYVLGGQLIAVATLVAFFDLCIPSKIYNAIWKTKPGHSTENSKAQQFVGKVSGIVLVIVSLGLNFNLSAQDQINSNFSFGGQIGQIQQDFSLGFQITTPFFNNNHMAVRLRGNLAYNQHLEGIETTWTPYSNVQLGMVLKSGQIGNNIRMYGEGGMIALFPSTNFSSESVNVGGYGLFGFEFFLNNCNCVSYFIEIGGAGTGAKADKIAGKPIYSNGLVTNVGLHFFLP